MIKIKLLNFNKSRLILTKKNTPIKPFIIIATILSCLVFLLFSQSLSWAGPPFFTDDPETVQYRHMEFYAASQYTNTKDGLSYSIPSFEFNYGVLPNVQLHLIAPFLYVKPDGGSSEYGFGDLELGIKFRIVQETYSLPMIGTFPLVLLPTGDKDKGLGSGETQVFLPVWAQKSWGPWTTYGGGGFWSNPGEGNKNWWFFGWLLQREINKNLTLGGELFHRTASTAEGEDGTGFQVGGFYNLTENHHVLFTVGRDFSGPNLLTFYLGYQLTFGPQEIKTSLLYPTIK